jgi:hypothetical protein
MFQIDTSGQIRPEGIDEDGTRCVTGGDPWVAEGAEVLDEDAGHTTAGLVRGAAGGDQQAWDALVERFASTVWAVARGYRLSVADASDVSRVTWLRLVEQLDGMERPDRLGAWLAATARRESLRVLRLAEMSSFANETGS